MRLDNSRLSKLLGRGPQTIHSLGLVYHQSPQKKIKLCDSTSVSRQFPIESDRTTEASMTHRLTTTQSPPKKFIEIPSLLESQPQYHFDPHYVNKSDSINPQWRAKLLAWMIGVGRDLKLHQTSIHMAIEYIDRFLSKCNSLAKKDLQVFGLCALLMATKQNEINAPKLKDLQRFTHGDLHKAEQTMLRTLRWYLHPLTCQEQTQQLLLCLQIYTQQNQFQFLGFRVQNQWYDNPNQETLSIKKSIADKVLSRLELLLCDADTLVFEQRSFCMALIYVLMGLDLQVFLKQNLRDMTTQSRFLCNQSVYNDFYGAFTSHFSIQLTELLPAVQHVCDVLQFVDPQQDLPHTNYLAKLRY